MTFEKGSTQFPPVSSPWGHVDYREEVGKGIWSISTPSHGGLWLEPAIRSLMPASCRETPYSSGGFFEEDCDCLLVYARFPEILRPGITLDEIHKYLRAQRSYFTDKRLKDLGVTLES